MEKIKALQRENLKLKQDKEVAEERATKAKKDKRTLQAQYDVLSVRFR